MWLISHLDIVLGGPCVGVITSFLKYILQDDTMIKFHFQVVQTPTAES